jgi:hypothetical protein
MNWDLLSMAGLLILLPTALPAILNRDKSPPRLTSGLLTVGAAVIGVGLVGLGAYLSAAIELVFVLGWGFVFVRDWMDG